MARKVLLADDSITIQKVVELILTEHGFDVKTVNNGQEAVTTMLSYTPDIVLADAEMPILNGYQLCERIKNNARTKHIPVILLAGAFEPIDTELAKKVNADGTLTKPFEAQELIARINSFLTEKKETQEVLIEEPQIEAPISGVTQETQDVTEELWEIEEPILEEVAEIAEPVQEITMEEPVEEQTVIKETPEQVFTPPTETKPEVTGEVTISSKVIEEAVIEAVKKVLETTDISSIIKSAIRDSIEKMLADRLPVLMEELTKELLKGSLSGISDQIERVIWETVPDLAENLITKEIERIKISLS